MPDLFNPNRIGSNNAGVDKEELFLKVWSGEVMSAFEQASVTLSRHRIKNISSGKSAQFILTGRIGAEYFVPGSELTGLDSPVSERTINLDGVLLSHHGLWDYDEAVAHYDTRGPVTAEMGNALAQQWDKNNFQEMVLGARSSAIVSDGNGGSQILNDAFKVGAGGAADSAEMAVELALGIFEAQRTLAEKDVPQDTVYAYIRPYHYYTLFQNKDLIDKQLNVGVNGGLDTAKLLKIANADVVMSNNVPSTNIAGGKHDVDASKTIGVIATPDAVGTVRLMDISTEAQWLIERQIHLMVSKMATGHGFLRPDCAVELSLDTLSN